MMPTLISRATDEELARFFDQAAQPEYRLVADKLFELIDLKRQLAAIEEELADKTARLECNECQLADIAEELATQQLHAA
jgi:hypothetical protein